MTSTASTAAVVGLGTMGAGIVEVFAKAGFDVRAIDVSDAAVQRGTSIITKSLAKAVEKGKLGEADRDAVLARVSWGTDLAAAEGVDIVVEAAFEDLEVKRDIFRRLSELVADDAVLATNSSSLSITAIAAASTHPERVLGVHFFNPAPVQALVEVITTLHTSDATRDRVLAILERLGKHPITVGDRAGFVVNHLLFGYLVRAITLYQDGFATREEIDESMVAAGCPMGPLALADLVGNDVGAAIGDRMFDELKDRLFATPPLLGEMVTAGLLGRKSGRGFYRYDGEPEAKPLVAAPVASRAAELPEALIVPYLNDCLRMVGTGYASPDDIDTGMSEGCRMPKPFDQLVAMGPRAVLEAQRRIFDETGEPGHKPCPLLVGLGEAADPDAALAALRR